MSQSTTTAPIHLRISVTDRCQLRCLYCMDPKGVKKFSHSDILSFDEIVRFVQVVKHNLGLSKVRITGGEPLVRRNIVQLVQMLGELVPGDLALTTNGQLLPELAGALKQAGLQRVNMSLDTLKANTYRRLTRGGELSQTLAGLDAAQEAGLTPVKLNMVVIKGLNELEVVELARFGLERKCTVRFLELMPIGPAAEHLDWFVNSQDVLGQLSQAFDVSPLEVRIGSSSRDYRIENSQGQVGRIGLISSRTTPFCNGCRRLRLTSAGQLIGCLARPEGPNIRHLLQDDGRRNQRALLETIDKVLGLKRKQRLFEQTQNMAKIGG